MLLDRQRRTRRIGKIRIGQQTRAANGKSYPTALDTFRFTCLAESTAIAVAELFGGEVTPWRPPGAGRAPEWEVVTEVSRLPVIVPPHERIVESWYELWDSSRRARRCDGRTVTLTGPKGDTTQRPCICPNDPAARLAGAKANPPTACKTMTHFQVMLPHLPELGVWALDTGSESAADEVADVADVLHRAADAGVYLPAELFISRRNRVTTGTSYPVPGLRTLLSLHELATGQLPPGDMRACMALLPEPPRFAAIAAARAARNEQARAQLDARSAPALPGAPAPEQARVVRAEVVPDPAPTGAPERAPAGAPPRPPVEEDAPTSAMVSAQDYADRAQRVQCSGNGTPADIDAIRAEATRHGQLEGRIRINGHPGTLADYLDWCTRALTGE